MVWFQKYNGLAGIRMTALPNIVHGLKEADVERQKAL